MATNLYKLGGWAFDNRRKVLLGWLVVLALVLFASSTFSGTFSSKFEVPGTESQQAQDLLNEKYPGAGGALRSRRLRGAGGREAHRSREQGRSHGVGQGGGQGQGRRRRSSTPTAAKAISQGRAIGYADVIYPMPADEVDDAARDELEESAEPAEAAGMQVEFGGGLVTEEAEAGSEKLGMMVGFLVLAITLGSLVAAGLPLLHRADRRGHLGGRRDRPHRVSSS